MWQFFNIIKTAEKVLNYGTRVYRNFDLTAQMVTYLKQSIYILLMYYFIVLGVFLVYVKNIKNTKFRITTTKYYTYIRIQMIQLMDNNYDYYNLIFSLESR